MIGIKNFVVLATLMSTTVAIVSMAHLSEAQACSPGEEELRWSVPSQGQVVPPDTQIFGISQGLAMGSEKQVTLRNEAGDSVDGEYRERALAGFVLTQTEFLPEELLAEGDYTLHVGYEQSFVEEEEQQFQEVYTVSFSVDESAAEPDAPGPADTEWWTESNSGTCYGPEVSDIVVTPSDDRASYFEIVVSQAEGDDLLTLVDGVGTDGRTYRMTTESPDCITVTGVTADGVHGESVEDCSSGGGCMGCSSTSGASPTTNLLLVVLALLAAWRPRRLFAQFAG